MSIKMFILKQYKDRNLFTNSSFDLIIFVEDINNMLFYEFSSNITPTF